MSDSTPDRERVTVTLFGFELDVVEHRQMLTPLPALIKRPRAKLNVESVGIDEESGVALYPLERLAEDPWTITEESYRHEGGGIYRRIS